MLNKFLDWLGPLLIDLDQAAQPLIRSFQHEGHNFSIGPTSYDEIWIEGDEVRRVTACLSISKNSYKAVLLHGTCILKQSAGKTLPATLKTLEQLNPQTGWSVPLWLCNHFS